MKHASTSMPKCFRRTTQIVLTLVLLAVIGSRIKWHDSVVLTNLEEAKLIADEGNTLLVETSDAGAQRIQRKQCSEITPGLLTILLENEWPILVGVFVVLLVIQVLLALRSKLILGLLNETATIGSLLIWQSRAQVISMVGIGPIGSDIVKGQQLVTGGHSIGSVTTAIVVERLMGLAAIMTLCAYGMSHLLPSHVWAGSWFPNTQLWTAGLLLAAVIGICVLLAAWGWIAKRSWRLLGPIVSVCNSHLRYLTQRPSVTITSITLSFLVHLAVVATYVLVDNALNYQTSWHLYLMAVPLICLLRMVPMLDSVLIADGSAFVLLTQLGGPSITQTTALCATLRLLDLSLRFVQLLSFWIHPQTTRHVTMSTERGDSLEKTTTNAVVLLQHH